MQDNSLTVLPHLKERILKSSLKSPEILRLFFEMFKAASCRLCIVFSLGTITKYKVEERLTKHLSYQLVFVLELVSLPEITRRTSKFILEK